MIVKVDDITQIMSYKIIQRSCFQNRFLCLLEPRSPSINLHFFSVSAHRSLSAMIRFLLFFDSFYLILCLGCRSSSKSVMCSEVYTINDIIEERSQTIKQLFMLSSVPLECSEKTQNLKILYPALERIEVNSKRTCRYSFKKSLFFCIRFSVSAPIFQMFLW